MYFGVLYWFGPPPPGSLPQRRSLFVESAILECFDFMQIIMPIPIGNTIKVFNLVLPPEVADGRHGHASHHHLHGRRGHLSAARRQQCYEYLAALISKLGVRDITFLSVSECCECLRSPNHAVLCDLVWAGACSTIIDTSSWSAHWHVHRHTRAYTHARARIHTHTHTRARARLTVPFSAGVIFYEIPILSKPEFKFALSSQKQK